MTNPADRDPVLMAVADGLETTAITRHNLRSNLLAHLSGGIPLAVPEGVDNLARATLTILRDIDRLLSERHRAEEAMRERAAEVADADVRVEAPTPPAATSDGEEDEWVEMDPIDLMDVSPLVAEALKAARQTIADLEQRLAEQTIAKVDYFASLVEAERQRDEATALLAEATNELHCCDDVPLDGGLASGIATLRRQRDDAIARTGRLWGAGQRLSNAAFNLSQRASLPEADRNSLRDGWKEWDRALLSEPQASEGRDG